MMPTEDARMIERLTEIEQRTAAGRCVALTHCPLLPEFRLHLIVEVGRRAGDLSFRTPHKVCQLHERTAADTLTVDDVARPSEQAMVIEAVRQECGWAPGIPVALRLAVRSA